MKRLLLALLLAASALPAAAQLRLQFVYNSDANAYWGGPVNAAAAINAAVADANASLAASAITGTIATPTSIAQVEIPNVNASDTYKQLIPTMLSTSIADLAQLNSADIIIAVTQHPFPNSSVGGTWKGDPAVDAVASVIVIDANVLMDGTSLLYWLGRQLGAKNQRAGGTNNETDGTAHGYWLKFGNSVANCEVTSTLDAQGVSPAMSGTCTAWIEGWKTPPVGGYKECSPDKWCQDYAVDRGPLNQCNASSCFGFSNWRMDHLSGSGNTLTCSYKADLLGVGTFNSAVTMGGGTPNSAFAFTCPNATALNVFSNPSLIYKGQPVGTANDNSAATISANFAAKSNTRNVGRPNMVRATLGYSKD